MNYISEKYMFLSLYKVYIKLGIYVRINLWMIIKTTNQSLIMNTN